jgi:hypothetical protein
MYYRDLKVMVFVELVVIVVVIVVVVVIVFNRSLISCDVSQISLVAGVKR